ncbi:hypothetical protein BDN67DRAFT_984854 [Paxillus ammoniavirescens]|nr:hypothetical protein BDN67DRAFT_984854 [Paxillus ammoniavirescens]
MKTYPEHPQNHHHSITHHHSHFPSIHPEQLDGDDTMRTCKTPAQTCADAVHNPGGQTDAPDSIPPSIWLEGERNGLTSLNIEVDDVETNGNHIEADHNNQKPSRNPVGTTDSDEHHPSKPTEPPDKKEGEQGVDGKLS